jgi:hypothetical protein
VHLGRLAIFFGFLALVGVLAALSERRARTKLRELRRKARELKGGTTAR